MRFFLKSKIYRVALACFLVLSMFSLAFADTIRLKDGSIIKGKIISFGEGKFTILRVDNQGPSTYVDPSHLWCWLL